MKKILVVLLVLCVFAVVAHFDYQAHASMGNLIGY